MKPGELMPKTDQQPQELSLGLEPSWGTSCFPLTELVEFSNVTMLIFTNRAEQNYLYSKEQLAGS